MSKHYIRLDSNNNIVYGFSDDFEQPLVADICINEDGGRHFELNGVINPPLASAQGIYLYKYVNNEVILKTEAEIQQEMLPSLADAQTSKMQEILDKFNEILNTKITSMANGSSTTFAYTEDDQTAWQKLASDYSFGFVTYPLSIPDANHKLAVFATADQLKKLFQDMHVREYGLRAQMAAYRGQTQTTQTDDDVAKVVVMYTEPTLS